MPHEKAAKAGRQKALRRKDPLTPRQRTGKRARYRQMFQGKIPFPAGVEAAARKVAPNAIREIYEAPDREGKRLRRVRDLIAWKTQNRSWPSVKSACPVEKKLGQFISRLRSVERGSDPACRPITPEERRLLDEAGFVWGPEDRRFRKVRDLVAWKTRNGKWPSSAKSACPAEKKLGQFIYKLRGIERGTIKGHRPITPEERRLLDRAGLEWSPCGS